MSTLPESINVHVPTDSNATAAAAVRAVISQQQLQQIQQAQILQQKLAQKLAQEEAARQQQLQQLQVQQLQLVQGLDDAALQQLIQGGSLPLNTNFNIDSAQLPPNGNTNNLLSALYVNQLQQPLASQPQLQAPDALLLQQEAQRQQAQAQALQLQALQSPMGGSLVSPQIQQLQIQLQIAQAQQAQAAIQGQAQPQLQVHDLFGSVLGGVSATSAQPNPSVAANTDVTTSLAATLNNANTSGTANNSATATTVAAATPPNAVPAASSAAEIVDWMKKSAPEAFQKLCQEAGLNPAASDEPGSPAAAKI